MKTFWKNKNAKIKKRSRAYKDYANTDSIKTLNSFNPELQLKDTESAIKNKLIHKMMIKQYTAPFI